MSIEHELLPLFIKRYERISLFNRTLKKHEIIQVQENNFKKYLKEVLRVTNERDDKDYLNEYYTLKHRIRYEIKRSLYSFRFMIQLL